MGSIEPVPAQSRPAGPVQRKPPIIPPAPTTRSMTVAGTLGLTFGLILFTWGSFSGWNIILMGVGLIFIAAGYHSRQKAPMKLCPACRLEIPLEATLCGHCHTEQPA